MNTRHSPVRRRHLRHTIGVALVVVLLAACGSDATDDLPAGDTMPDTSEPADTTTAAGSADTDDVADRDSGADLASALADRTWLSTDVSGRTLVDGSQIRLTFEDGSLATSADCNTMGGSYAIDGDALVAPDLFATEMGCEPALMDQDAWIGELLRSRPTLALDGDQLTITGTVAGDQVVVTLLDRVVADPDLPLVGTTWTVDGIVTGDSVSSVPIGGEASITIGDDGRAAIRTGCNTGNATVEIGDDTIAFGPMALTRMACAPDLDRLERAVVEVMAGEVAYTIEAGRLTLDTLSGTGETTGLTLTAAG